MAKHSSAAKRAAMRQQPEEDPEFQIAPMIDILLVLLVFFMSISSTEVLQKTDVALPVAKDAKDVDPASKNQTGQVIVNVLWGKINNAGSIELNGSTFALPGDIVPILQKRLNEVPTLRILVRADRNARYEFIKLLLKAVGTAGGTNVTFSVVDKDKDQPAATASTP